MTCFKFFAVFIAIFISIAANFTTILVLALEEDFLSLTTTITTTIKQTEDSLSCINCSSTIYDDVLNSTLTTPIDEESIEKHKNDTNDTLIKELKKNTKKLLKKHAVHAKSCSCDLQVDLCDINCCCDQDCSVEKAMVFSHCSSELHRQVNNAFCNYYDYIYKNNTLHEFEVNQNGLFCVIKSNLPKQFVVQRKKKIETLEDVKLQLNSLVKSENGNRNRNMLWKEFKFNVKNENENKQQGSDLINKTKISFKAGDLMILLRNGTVEDFNLPCKFVTSACIGKRPVRYLEDLDLSCVQTKIVDNHLLNARYYFENVTFVSMMTMGTENRTELNVNATKINNTSTLNVSRSLIENFNESQIPPFSVQPTVKICSNNDENNCKNLTLNDSLTPHCNTSLINYKSFCKNLASKITYLIQHNGTKGVVNIQILITLKNVTFNHLEPQSKFKQQFIVKFQWFESNSSTGRNYSRQRSGNPGYKTSFPILTSNLFINETLIYNPEKNTSELKIEKIILKQNKNLGIKKADNFLMITGRNQQGKCVLNEEDKEELIEFGFNSILKCEISNTILMPDRKNVNASSICKAIQLFIFKHWFINASNTTRRLIGIYGNADKNNKEDWDEVLYNYEPWIIINNKTNGSFDENHSKLLCTNLVSFLKIVIFHSRTIVGDLINQEKIVKTVYLFEELYNASFVINNNKNLISFDIPLRTEINFIDVSERIVRKFADPPTFDIKLPFDFFYPFIKIQSNNEANNSFSHSYIYLLILISLINIYCI